MPTKNVTRGVNGRLVQTAAEGRQVGEVENGSTASTRQVGIQRSADCAAVELHRLARRCRIISKSQYRKTTDPRGNRR